jgi:hypothetical protein
MEKLLALPHYKSNSVEYRHIKYRVSLFKRGMSYYSKKAKTWKSQNQAKVKESWTKFNAKPENKSYRQNYYKTNKDVIAAKKKEHWHKYYINNVEKVNLKNRINYIKNKARVLRYNRAWRELNKFAVISYYSNDKMCCENCRENIYELLTIDHINGAGNKHRRSIVSGSNFCLWLRRNNFPPGFQILCYNCNMIKGRVSKERYDEITNELKKRKLSMISIDDMRIEN